MMPPQRARGAESRVRNKLSNGPLRAQSKALAEYSATCGHTSVAGDMLVSRRAHGVTAVNQGGTADRLDSPLRDRIGLSRAFFYFTINGARRFFTWQAELEDSASTADSISPRR